jgi:hypothetical protein
MRAYGGVVGESIAAAAPEGAADRRGRELRPQIALVIAASALGLLIAIIAILGGFNSVTRPGHAEYGIDESFTSSHLDLTVERIAVLDELSGSGSYPDEDAGERVLAVLIDVTNMDAEPRTASDQGSLTAIRLDHRPDDRPNVSVYGDGDFSAVTLQPDVPTRVLLTWIVEEDEISDDEVVRLMIPDSEKSESTLFKGESLWFPLESRVAVTAPVEDLGTGSADGRL